MKKSLLLTAAFATLAIAGNAQAIESKAAKPGYMPLTERNFTKIDKEAVMSGKIARPRKDATTGVYYTRPEGSLWVGTTKSGGGYAASLLNVAPYKSIIFNNMSTGAENSVWTSSSGETVTDGVDESYNLNFGYFAGYNYYIASDDEGTYRGPIYYTVPTLTVGSNSFTLGETSDYFSQYGTGVRVDTLSPMSHINNRTAIGYYGFGAFNEGYLYGSGTLTFQDVVYNGVGFLQSYPAPMAPLYVEGLHSTIFTKSEPLTEDATVTALIIEMVNDSTLGDTIATLTATADDCTLLEKDYYTNDAGTFSLYNIDFTQKELDELGQPTVVPFTIDCPYQLQIVGTSNEGVDFGFCGLNSIAEDDVLADYGPTYIVLEYEGENYYLRYPDTHIDVNFDALFDNVVVNDTLYDSDGNPAYTNLNVLRVSADGQTISTEGSTEDTNIGAAVLTTTFDWTDGNTEVDNYTFTNMPEWISFDRSQNLDESARLQSQESQGVTYCFAGGYTMLNFNVDPLPEGTTGRAARIYVQGRGVTAELPIIILQGDANIADAIQSAEADKRLANSRIYNLRGQQVDNSFKGVRIQNGKLYVK